MMLAIVQARMTSTRLPGKVLADLAGKPLVWHTVSRLEASSVCDRVLVATSEHPSDDPVAAWCREAGVGCFRGSLDDVLDRYYRAATHEGAERVLRATADCPMLDPRVVARAAGMFDPGRFDYVSNTVRRTFPKGLDVEVFSFAALETAWREARLPSEREHVTPFIRNRPERFRLGELVQDTDRSAWRWTVDEPRDLEFARAVFEALGRTDFGQEELANLLVSRPELARINDGIDPDEGYRRSLERDRAWLVDPKGRS